MAEGTTDTQVLWQEFKRTGDRALRDRLILTYAPLVKYVAGRLGSGFAVKMTLEIPSLGVKVPFDGEIRLK